MDISASDLILTFKEQEVQALLGLLDAAVKAQGLNSVINAAVIYQKIISSTKEQSKQQPDNKPMKRYIAILNQNDSAPIATVLENSLGPIVWTRSGPGVYLGTLSGAFPSAKTTALCGDGQGGEQATLTTVELPANSEDYVLVTTKDMTAENGVMPADGLLVRTTVEIRVYQT